MVTLPSLVHPCGCWGMQGHRSYSFPGVALPFRFLGDFRGNKPMLGPHWCFPVDASASSGAEGITAFRGTSAVSVSERFSWKQSRPTRRRMSKEATRWLFPRGRSEHPVGSGNRDGVLLEGVPRRQLSDAYTQLLLMSIAV